MRESNMTRALCFAVLVPAALASPARSEDLALQRGDAHRLNRTVGGSNLLTCRSTRTSRMRYCAPATGRRVSLVR